MRKVWILVPFLVCFYWSLNAQNVRIRLENCELDAKASQQIKNTTDFQLAFFADLFKKPVDSVFNVRIFGNKKEFIKYSKTYTDANPAKNDAKAFYNTKLREIILLKDVDDFPNAFAHELSHAILHSYCATPDIWLDEGLADVLEDLSVTSATSVANRAKKIENAQYFINTGASIRAVIESDDFYQKDDNYRNYTLSFAAVLYLLNTRKDILVNLAKSNFGYTDFPLLTNYPQGIDLFEVDVKTFLLSFKLTGAN